MKNLTKWKAEIEKEAPKALHIELVYLNWCALL